MRLLLTDREIRLAWGDRRSPNCGIVDCDKAIAEAQLKKVNDFHNKYGMWALKQALLKGVEDA